MILLSIPTLPGRAGADEDARRRARAFFDSGETQYRLGNFAGALLEYQKALKLVRRPSIIFNIAQCHRQLGNHKRALFFYKLYLADFERQNPGQAPPYLEEVNGHVRQLSRLADRQEEVQPPPAPPPPAPGAGVGLVHLKGVPAGSRVFVNGILVAQAPLAVPIRLSPGRNRLEVVAEGSSPWSREVQIAAGQELHLLVELYVNRPRSTLWLALGITTAVLALGSEGLALGYTGKANDTQRADPVFDTYRSIAIGGHVGAGVLVLGSVASFVLYYLSGGEERRHAGGPGAPDGPAFTLLPGALPGGGMVQGSLRF